MTYDDHIAAIVLGVILLLWFALGMWLDTKTRRMATKRRK